MGAFSDGSHRRAGRWSEVNAEVEVEGVRSLVGERGTTDVLGVVVVGVVEVGDGVGERAGGVGPALVAVVEPAGFGPGGPVGVGDVLGRAVLLDPADSVVPFRSAAHSYCLRVAAARSALDGSHSSTRNSASVTAAGRSKPRDTASAAHCSASRLVRNVPADTWRRNPVAGSGSPSTMAIYRGRPSEPFRCLM